MKKVLVRASILMCVAAFSLSMAAVDSTQGVKLSPTKWVPKDSFIVYLGAGHSNMVGRSGKNTDSTPHPRCWNYQIDGTVSPAAWVPAVGYPSIHSDGGTARGNGPWVSWLKKMANRHPGYYFGVIANPDGGNSLGVEYKAGTGGMYTELMTNAKKWKGKCTFGGVMTMLGEAGSDLGSSTNAAAFANNAKNFILALRTELEAPYMPLYVSQYEAGSTGDWSPTLQNARTIIAQMWTIPSIVSYAVTVPSDINWPMVDSHHYNNAGQDSNTTRHLDSMHAKGWFPDARTVAVKKHDMATQLQPSSRISVEKSGGNLTNLVISFPGMVKNPSISVFDSKGKLVSGKAGMVAGNQVRYAISGGLSGFYVVKVAHDGGSFVKKLVLAN